jgi:RHS repeat-associated protein
MAWAAPGKSGVDPQVISLPTGPGSAQGLGDAFEPTLNSGTASYSVKLQACPGIAGFSPEISFSYDAGYGSGVLGLGWKLSVPGIQRQTDKRLPRYQAGDAFSSDTDGELVPVSGGFYRPKIEGSFTRYSLLENSGWECLEKDGTRHGFGITSAARVTTPQGVFRWMLERSDDSNGNIIRYSYSQYDGIPYLSEIHYAEVPPGTGRSISFEYETRPDSVASCLSRTLLVMTKRIRAVSVFSSGSLVRRYVFNYTSAPGTSISLLSSVVQYGSDGLTALPPLVLEYTSVNLALAVTVSMANPPSTPLSNGEADLVDVDGDGLPDILHTPQTGHEFHRNLGRGKWDSATEKPVASPSQTLSMDGVFMGDLNGDGLSDLVVQTSQEFGYYENTGKPWERGGDWKPYAGQPSFSLENPSARLLDLDNDGLMDVLLSRTDGLEAYFNSETAPWTTTRIAANPGISLEDPAVRIADMNGDGLEDILFLDPAGWTYYLPNLGMGDFGESISMAGAPFFSSSALLDGTLLAADVNGDGFADMAIAHDGEVQVFLNQGNDSFGPSVSIPDAPAFAQSPPSLRAADMNGDGCRDLLYSFANAPVNEQYQYLDFSRGTRPNLLTAIKNSMGRSIRIFYRPSTDDYLSARDSGRPWTTKLPFPVQVVSRREVHDNHSGKTYVTTYQYRDGYYDPLEREFRGFAEVVMTETGDATAPTRVTRHYFDVGREDESRKGMLLVQASLAEGGDISPANGLFQRLDNQVETRLLATGQDGRKVRFSFIRRQDTAFFENTAASRNIRSEFDVDQYGNETARREYGEVNGNNLGLGNDELLTATTYWIQDSENGPYMADRPLAVLRKDLAGNFVAASRFTYDTRGNMTMEEASPDGASYISVIRKEYDTYGNPIKLTDANSHSRSIGYDPETHSLPVSETLDDLGLSIRAEYDPVLCLPSAFTDMNGHTTRFGYDALGRLVKIVKPGDTMALPTKEFQYVLSDPASRIVSREREVSGGAETFDTVTWFDGLGRKLAVCAGGGDGKWAVSEAVAFNARGGVRAKWLPFWAAVSALAECPAPDLAQPHVETEYDPMGRSVREKNPDGSFKATEYLPLAKRVWDEEDTNPAGSHAGTPHTFTSDGRERLVQVEERNGPETYTTQYGYDSLGNLIRVTDTAGTVKTMAFDGMGRKTRMEDPDRGLLVYTYDGVGNLLQTVDAKGQVTSWTYDAANRPLSENCNGTRVRWHYDSDLPADGPALDNTLGRLAWVEDEAGRVFFSYNPRGNTVKKERETRGLRFVFTCVFDAMDRLTRLEYPDGMAVEYQYDSLNRLSAVPGFAAEIAYNAAGQKTRFLYANGAESHYSYDARERLTGLATASGGALIQDLSYSYDKVSNITAITDGRTNPSPESRTQAFSYDNLYRLAKCQAAAGWEISYLYDGIGNMLRQTSNVADPKVNLGDFLYGEGPAGPHAVTRAGNFAYTYDANGNLASKTGYTFHFDYKDRMESLAREAGSLTAVYLYDYEGGRVVKDVAEAGITQTTLYIGQYAEVRDGRLVEHVFAGDRRVASISRSFTPELLAAGGATRPTPGELDANQDGVVQTGEIRMRGADPARMETLDVADALGVYKGNFAANPGFLPFTSMAAAARELGGGSAAEVVYYVPDHLGSPSVVTDASGAVVEESVLYPYGMDRSRIGSYAADYRFTGKEPDEESGLHYFGARYYDSIVGRFVSVDHLESEQNKKNGYIYSNSNPIKYIDTNGYFSIDFGIQNFANMALDAGSMLIKSKTKIDVKALDILKAPTNLVDSNITKTLWKIGKAHTELIIEGLKQAENITKSGAKSALNYVAIADAGYELVDNSLGVMYARSGATSFNELYENNLSINAIQENISFYSENPNLIGDALIDGMFDCVAVGANTTIDVATRGYIDINLFKSGDDIKKPLDKAGSFLGTYARKQYDKYNKK